MMINKIYFFLDVILKALAGYREFKENGQIVGFQVEVMHRIMYFQAKKDIE